MGAEKQHTLSNPVEFAGVGLHSGEDCRIIINPADENAGISFLCAGLNRADRAAERIIVASPENVVGACHGTTLANGHGQSVSTVEHVMAALAVCAIDNAEIDVFGGEMPILDGSAEPFVGAIRSAGRREQRARRSPIVIEEPIVVADGDRSIAIEPADTFRLGVTIEFDDCLIGKQSLAVKFDDDDLLTRIARSRTFCRRHEIDFLRQQQLIRGGSLENSIVVDGERILNDEALRDPQEFVLHKVLDLIGDLYLLGAPIRGHVRAYKPGHDLNTRAALAIAEATGRLEPAIEPVAATA
ncbi:MAG: UDP-3-O-acyl-N-acetylglucosamine deacetylase [Hyphococcus sp.]